MGRAATLAYTGSRLDTVTLADGRIVDYGYSNDRLSSVKALDGAIETYGYDGSGRLNKVTDAAGKAVATNVYDTQGRVVSQTDPANNITKFAYSKNGEFDQTDTTAPDGGVWTDIYYKNVLFTQIDPLGNKSYYRYDARFNRTSDIDGEGRKTTREYSATGQLAYRGNPASNERWTYNTDGTVATHKGSVYDTTTFGYTGGLLTSVKDPLGKTSTLTYSATTGLLETSTTARGKTTRYAYDTLGNLTSLTTPTGAKTTYTYHPSGQVKTVTDPRGNLAGATPAQYTTSFTYDAADRVKTVTDPRGGKTSYDYDVLGLLRKATDAKSRVTLYDYDTLDRLTKVTDPVGKTTLSTYNAMSRPATVTDRTGATTSYEYDKAGRQIKMVTARGNTSGAVKADHTWTYGYDKVGNRKTVTDPKGKTTAITWNADDQALTVTDPLNHTRKVDYDGNGRMTKTYDGLGNGTILTYDAAGRLTTSETARDVTTYGYDDDGNLTSVQNPEGGRTTHGYDDDGRRTTSVEPRGNAIGADPAKYTWQFGFDAAGHPVSVKNPLGHQRTAGFDALGNVAWAKDGRGKQTLFEYDELGRNTKVTNPDGGITLNGYNAAGHLETSTNAKQQATTYGYDAEGRVTSVKNPLGKTVAYAYDPDGNRTTTTNARGQKITTTIDGRGLPTKVTYSDGTPTVTYTHDDAGRIKTVADATGTRTATYNDDNRIAAITSPGLAGSFQYAWNTDGTVRQRTYPDGRRTSYTYDRNDQVTAQTTDGKTTGYAYDPAGNVTSITLPTTTARSETRTYDEAGRLSSLTAPAAGTRSFGYDENDRLVRESPATGYPTRRGYDDAGRLTRACTDTSATSCLPGISGTTHTYDKVGNTTATMDGDLPAAWSNMAQTVSGDVNNDGISDIIAADKQGTLHTYLGRADGTFALGQTQTGNSPAGFTQILPIEYTGDGNLDILAIDKTTGHLLRYNGDGNGGFAAPNDRGQGWAAMTLSAGDFNKDGKQDFLAVNSSSDRMYFYPGTGAGGFDFSKRIDFGTGWGTSRLTLLDYDGDSKLDVLAVNNTDGHLYFHPGDGAGGLGARVDRGGGWAAMHLVPGDFNNDNKQDFLAVDTARKKLRFYPGNGTGGFGTYILQADDWAPYSTPAPLRFSTTGNLGVVAADTSGQLRLWQGDGQGKLTGAVPVNGRTTNSAYDTGDRLTSTTTGTEATGYTYDDDGNQLTDGNETYTYDPVGRIKTAAVGADTYAFTYDSDGNRTTTKKNNTLTSTSRWDINNPLAQLATDTDATGALVADYQYDPDGTARSMDRTAGKYYFAQDRQNSVSTVYDAAGTDNYRYTYNPWGKTTGTATVTGGQTSPFGYTGQYKDQTLPDRLQLRARSYDPAQQRFTTADPVSAPLASPNRSAYNYANNDPTNLSDPSGACPMCIGAGIGAVFSAGIYAYTHQDDFNWRDFAAATAKGALIGAGAGFLAPAGAGLAATLGLSGGRALAVAAITDAGIGAAFSWFINTAQCQPTTPTDLLIGALSGGFAPLVKPALSSLKSGIATRYGVASEGNLISSLLYGARPGVNLPGYEGVAIPRRPTFTELENLTVKHGVEFAVTYKYGPGRNGGGGQYYLHAGGQSHVRFPLEPDRMLVYHTHPKGAHSPSEADERVLESLERLGSPQRVSGIIPVGGSGKVQLFDKEGSAPWLWKTFRL
ncbi:FG-GAP-like repeat-containing protein [Streptomyces sp. NPDC055254]